MSSNSKEVGIQRTDPSPAPNANHPSSSSSPSPLPTQQQKEKKTITTATAAKVVKKGLKPVSITASSWQPGKEPEKVLEEDNPNSGGWTAIHSTHQSSWIELNYGQSILTNAIDISFPSSSSDNTIGKFEILDGDGKCLASGKNNSGGFQHIEFGREVNVNKIQIVFPPNASLDEKPVTVSSIKVLAPTTTEAKTEAKAKAKPGNKKKPNKKQEEDGSFNKPFEVKKQESGGGGTKPYSPAPARFQNKVPTTTTAEDALKREFANKKKEQEKKRRF